MTRTVAELGSVPACMACSVNTATNWRHPRYSRKADVATLDAFIGPKR